MESFQNLAPIVLFVYNRPEHTRKTLQALSLNRLASDSKLYIYCDGISANATDEEIGKNRAVKKIISDVSGFEEIKIIERPENYGLARNIIDGVTNVVNKHGKIIVLEDDIVTSPYFLTFMNESLEKYGDVKRVMHVSGFLFESKNQDKLPETFFLKFMSCWGWGTWVDRWEQLIEDPSRLLNQLNEENSLSEFNLDGVISFDKQLKYNIEGKKDTWAIKWFTTIFLNDGLCLYPRKSLVRNIGLDGSGVHYRNKASNKQNKAYISNLAKKKIQLYDISINESETARNYLKEYFRLETTGDNRISSKFRTFLKKLWTVFLKKLKVALDT